MYKAPLKDLRFVLNELLCVQELSALPRYAEFSSELAESILEQAARFGEQVLAPINVLGDTQGARFVDGSVRFMCSWATTPDGVDELAAALNAVA